MAFDPRTKIILLATIGVLMVLLDSPIMLSFCFSSVFGLAVTAIRSWKKIGIFTGVLVIGTWGTIYSQAIFYDRFPRTILFTLVDNVHFYREGLVHGMIQSLRFSTSISVGYYVISTTKVRDLLVGLIKLRVPYGLAFMTTVAIQYVPLVVSDAKIVIQSQRLRGFRYFRVNILRTFAGFLNAARPILTNSIRRATNLSQVIECRGFSVDGTNRQVALRGLSFGRGDLAFILVQFILLTSVVILKILYFLYVNGVFFASWLRPVYTFTKEVL